MRHFSIATRMLIVAFVPALIVTLLLSVYFVVNRVSEIEKSELDRARTLAEGLALASEFALVTKNRELLDGIALSALYSPSIQAVRFFDIDSNPVHERNDEPGSATESASVAGVRVRALFSALPLINQVEAPIMRTDLSQFDDPVFGETDSPTLGDERATRRIGSLALTVDLSGAYQRQLATVGQGLIMLGLVLGVSMLFAYRLADSVSAPVHQLTRAVRRLAQNDYSVTPPINAGGEIGELSRGVAHLARELQSFHGGMNSAIRAATGDLQATLRILERQNRELEDARLSAEQASAFKSAFLANMSHEIRTPMNTIIGTLSLMNLHALDRDQKEQVTAINQASESLLHLIDDVLDMSRIESGNLHLETVDTDLQALLEAVSRVVSQPAVDKGIELFISPIPHPAVSRVRTDPLRLRQVLINLISNAVKFTPAGHVLLEVVVDSLNETDCRLMFSVTDTGIGIESDKQSSLFSAFTQVDMSTTRHYGGTGLGLHICREIVNMMGGEISVSSALHAGARFDVHLPMDLCALTSTQTTEPDTSLWRVRYIDSYAPLEEHNRLALLNADIDIQLTDDGDEEADRLAIDECQNDDAGKIDSSRPDDDQADVYLFNVPNHMLDPRRLVRATYPLPTLDKPAHALVSQVTPAIRDWLQRSGFTGYVVRTPHLEQLRESFHHAVSGRSFQALHTSIPPAEEKPRSARPCEILAVDDQEINLDLMSRYFKHLGVSGVLARSSSEALTIAAERSFDLILLDLHMPGEDGFATVRQLRESDQVNSETAILAMTADAFSSTRERALAAGFDQVLTKPATVDQVSEAIEFWTRCRSSGGAPSDSDAGARRASSEEAAPTSAVARQVFMADPEPLNLTEPLLSVDACADAVFGDRRWARKALASYGQEAPLHVAELHRLLAACDHGGLDERAHAIKGVSAICRSSVLVQAAESVQHACRGRADTSVLHTRVARLVALLEEAERECRRIEAEEREVMPRPEMTA